MYDIFVSSSDVLIMMELHHGWVKEKTYRESSRKQWDTLVSSSMWKSCFKVWEVPSGPEAHGKASIGKPPSWRVFPCI